MISYIKYALLGLLIESCNGSSSVQNAQDHRQLAFPLFFSYEPKTQVSDHAAIDMDQKDIETEITRSSSLGFAAARRIYTEGGHSRSYASLSLIDAVDRDLKWGTSLTGYTVDGQVVTGTIEKNVVKGYDVVWFLYDINNQLGNHVGCQVGGTTSPMVEGCLAPRGTLVVGGADRLLLNYTYDPMTGNRNGRRFDKFSTEAKEKMFSCTGAGCPYPEFMKFYNYYGEYEYADTWIRSAFEGLETRFNNGNADFSDISRDGRAEAVLTATTYLSLWMYIIREMELAIDTCISKCGPNSNNNGELCADDNVHAWDQAVAFYVGSMERGSGGYLQYSLSNRMCLHFGTCGYNGVENTGTSYVNFAVLKEFEAGQENIVLGRCDALKKNKERIVQLMTVPLVQATIRQAHLTDHLSGATDKEIGEGATFAAGVLPLVHACNPSDAEIIYDNMQIGSGRKNGVASFDEVKGAFERNYVCMGITCDDIGGIIDKRSGGYYDNTEPCNSAHLPKSSSSSSSSSHSQQQHSSHHRRRRSSTGLVIGIIVAIAAVIGGAFLLFHDKFRNQVEFKGKATDLELEPGSGGVAAHGVGYSDGGEAQDEMGTSSRSTTDSSLPPGSEQALSTVQIT